MICQHTNMCQYINIWEQTVDMLEMTQTLFRTLPPKAHIRHLCIIRQWRWMKAPHGHIRAAQLIVPFSCLKAKWSQAEYPELRSCPIHHSLDVLSVIVALNKYVQSLCQIDTPIHHYTSTSIHWQINASTHQCMDNTTKTKPAQPRI